MSAGALLYCLMKTPRIADALTQVDDDIVSGAVYAKKVKKNNWLKWGSVAACFVVMLAVMVTIMPMLFEDNSPVITPTNPSDEGAVNEGEISEGKLEKYYDYGIDKGAFATYINGKVIDAEKVGTKLESVTVTGGWKNESGEWISTETLNAEVYEITGIDSGIAVALKFIDQGEAVTTTHYYVMMNPDADLSIVKEYVREPIVQNNPSDEMVNE